jgi:hypothetical protein
MARARAIMEAYGKLGVGPERVLIKLASTWEASGRRSGWSAKASSAT